MPGWPVNVVLAPLIFFAATVSAPYLVVANEMSEVLEMDIHLRKCNAVFTARSFTVIEAPPFHNLRPSSQGRAGELL